MPATLADTIDYAIPYAGTPAPGDYVEFAEPYCGFADGVVVDAFDGVMGKMLAVRFAPVRTATRTGSGARRRRCRSGGRSSSRRTRSL